MANAESIPADVDLYTFLSLSSGPASSAAEIKKAYRQTSIKYHPDKVAPTPENLANFHLLQVALATLTDADAKTKYDSQRDARLRRRAEVEALDARRRKLREDLEARETNVGDVRVDGPRGQKRTMDQRETSIRRIAEENRRKMEEKVRQRKLETEMRNAKARAEEAKNDATVTTAQKDTDTNGYRQDSGPDTPDNNTHAHSSQADTADTMSRSLKLRWIREGEGLEYDGTSISTKLPVDEIEDLHLLKDKKRRIESRDKKVMLGTAVVIFKTVQAARSVLEEKSKLFDFETIDWLAKKDDELT